MRYLTCNLCTYIIDCVDLGFFIYFISRVIIGTDTDESDDGSGNHPDLQVFEV